MPDKFVLIDYPRLFLVVSVLLLWAATHLGALFGRKWRPLKDDEREDFNLIMSASLTLLGLIIGFSFSMAVSRYDQRKNYEEAEANAIGTEYVRADLLGSGVAGNVKTLVKNYLQLRIKYYEEGDERNVPAIDASTLQVQDQMWSAVQAAAASQPNQVVALAVAGMNDVLNSQGYTQAAWWNR